MIRPHPRSVIPRSTAWMQYIEPYMLSSMNGRQNVRSGVEEPSLRDALGDPRVVDEDVDRAELGLDPRDRLEHLTLVGDVERPSPGTGRRRPRPLPATASARSGVQVVDGDPHAGPPRAPASLRGRRFVRLRSRAQPCRRRCASPRFSRT